MEDHGYRLQYSVFICDLSAAELRELESEISAVMHLLHDSIIRIDLGAISAPTAVHTIGRRRQIPNAGPQIV